MCKWGDEVKVKLDGQSIAFVDRCIAPIIQALNDGGIKTVASCCGHGHINGTIALGDGRWLEIYPDRATFERESPAMNSRVDIHGNPKLEQEIDLTSDYRSMGIIEALFGKRE